MLLENGKTLLLVILKCYKSDCYDRYDTRTLRKTRRETARIREIHLPGGRKSALWTREMIQTFAGKTCKLAFNASS